MWVGVRKCVGVWGRCGKRCEECGRRRKVFGVSAENVEKCFGL